MHCTKSRIGETFRPGSGAYLIALAMFCALAWGSAFPVVRLARLELPAITLPYVWAFAGIRFTIAGLIVLLLLTRKKPWNVARANSGKVFCGVFFQVFCQYIFFYWALKVAPAYLVAVTSAAGTLWWAGLAPIFDKRESLSWKQAGFIVLGIGGVALATWKPGTVIVGDLTGVALTLASTLCGTVAVLLVRPLASRGVSPTFYNGLSLFFGGIMLCLLAAPVVGDVLAHASLKLWAMTLHLALISAFCFSIWYHLITLYEVSRMASYRLLIPFAGVCESIIFIPSEKPGPGLLFGGLLIVGGILAMERLRRKAQHS